MDEKPDETTGQPEPTDPVEPTAATGPTDPAPAEADPDLDPADSIDAPSPLGGPAPPPVDPPLAASSVGPPFGPPVDPTTPFDSPQSAPSPPPPEPTSLSENPPGLRRQGRDPRRVGLGVAMVGLALASGVTGAIGAVTLVDDDDNSSNSIADTQNQFDTASEESEEQPTPEEPLSQAAAAVLPSVVSITTSDGRLTGEGSGVIISDDGLVLTNNHVVGAAGDGGEVSVTIADGTTTTAEVVGTDPASDLAVIQITNADELDLTPAELGNSSDLVVGDTVLAIGSPLGLEGSVSAGIVSALERAIVLSPEAAEDPFGQQEEEQPSSSNTAVIAAIQTDAAINPGNSGGPLVNTDGEVVGINTAIASLADGMGTQGGSIGLGFAIPIDDARAIAEQLANGEEVTHAFLGVQIGDSADANGAVIGDVEDGSPADQAGLEPGDIVTAIDGETVNDSTALTATIRSHEPGDTVSLTVERDDEELTIEATLGELP